MASENKAPTPPQQVFQFSIGPVQGFVAQARRTRDFWAGSFLLSWLTGIAILEVERQGGKVDFPIPPAGYLNWIRTGKGQGTPPRQGAIPNQFKAVIPASTKFNGALVAHGVREAWKLLAEHIWQQDDMDHIATPATRAIWDRQHANFWEINWVISEETPNDTDGSNAKNAGLLDQRKYWRTHYGVGEDGGEPGVKCMVMDGWQELSGSERPGRSGDAFWKAVRSDDTRKGIASDLQEKEQLCAIAYVKRRFARHFGSFYAVLSNELSVYGWGLKTGMPSVSYMAAVHWLEQVVQKISPDDAYLLLEAAQEVSPERVEWDTYIQCLQDAVRVKGEHWNSVSDLRKLLALDAGIFFEHVQDNPRANQLDQHNVHNLRREMGRQKLSYPAPFYAILLMDGDALGQHMREKAKQETISHALNTFTSAVHAIVHQHNGLLIYAGGDDVLAILPLENAMGCAAAVRQCYLDSFAAQPVSIPATISAAIEFVHVKMPLGKVLGDAHPLLDDIAKDKTGRDAIAVRVWKTGRMVLEWAQPWAVALDSNPTVNANASNCLAIERIAKEFRVLDQKDSGDDTHQMSNKFFFKIREHFALLNPAHKDTPPVLNEREATELLAVDYFHSANNRETLQGGVQEAVEIIAPLLTQCRPVRYGRKSNVLHVDGALLVRFLVQKGLQE